MLRDLTVTELRLMVGWWDSGTDTQPTEVHTITDVLYMSAGRSIYRAAVLTMFAHETLLQLDLNPLGVFCCNKTSGKIIVCLTGLALLIRLCPRHVKIFPNRVFFTAALARDFKNYNHLS